MLFSLCAFSTESAICLLCYIELSLISYSMYFIETGLYISSFEKRRVAMWQLSSNSVKRSGCFGVSFASGADYCEKMPVCFGSRSHKPLKQRTLCCKGSPETGAYGHWKSLTHYGLLCSQCNKCTVQQTQWLKFSDHQDPCKYFDWISQTFTRRIRLILGTKVI